jgi:hypothetical protein
VPTGELVPLLISFVNEEVKAFNVSYVWAELTSPTDFSRKLYQFPPRPLDDIVPADGETAFDYSLAMPPVPEAMEARLAVIIQYADASRPDAPSHAAIPFNGTVSLLPAVRPFEVRRYLPFVLGLLLGGAGLWLLRTGIAAGDADRAAKSGPKAGAGSHAGAQDNDDEDALAGVVASSRSKPSKRAAAAALAPAK